MRWHCQRRTSKDATLHRCKDSKMATWHHFLKIHGGVEEFLAGEVWKGLQVVVWWLGTRSVDGEWGGDGPVLGRYCCELDQVWYDIQMHSQLVWSSGWRVERLFFLLHLQLQKNRLCCAIHYCKLHLDQHEKSQRVVAEERESVSVCRAHDIIMVKLRVSNYESRNFYLFIHSASTPLVHTYIPGSTISQQEGENTI